MAITGFTESSLSNSEVWAGINEASGEKDDMIKKAINLIKTSKHLTNEDIEAAYISVRQITDSLTRAAMKAFDEGTIVLIYNNVKALSMSQAVPFITFKSKSNNKYITYVFMDNYIKIDRNGLMSLQAPILRDLLIGALIANSLKKNYQQLSSNQYMQKVMTEIYTGFVTRIINREFSIAADKVTFDVVKYWINKFFLINIFQAMDTKENIERVASSHFKYIDDIKYEEIKNQYDEKNPIKISELLELIKTASPRLKTINLATFISQWISYYYVPAYLAIDNIEYLIFMCITLLSGNNIISIAAADIVKETKNIKSFRGELLKLVD